MSRAELAAAVSQAGGLGIITSFLYKDKQELREEIKKAKEITDKPFGININLFPTSARTIDNDDVVEVVLEEKIPLVETSGGTPKPYLERLHEGGIKVMHKVTTLPLARRMEEIGCDLVTIVTYGGGGHPGLEETAAGVIIPAAVKALKIPVLVAGGLADGRGLLAALALGAGGVLMGTRFMATKECPMHPTVKEWMVKAQAKDTMLIDQSIGSARRVMRTPNAERVLGMQELKSKIKDLLPLMGGQVSVKLWRDGDFNQGVLACGQACGLVEDAPSVKELIERMAGEAQEAWLSLSRCLGAEEVSS